MYVRDNPAAPIVWEPSDLDAAATAMVEVDGTGIAAATDIDPDNPVEVTDDVAAQVRDHYRDLVDQQTDGGTS